MFEKIVLASGNQGKLREFGELLAPLGVGEVLSQSALGVTETDEPHGTFLENALKKARHASAQTGLAAMADDSGLCVDVLGGAPGVLSARFAGEPKSDARNNLFLLEKLKDETARQAYFYCVLVLVRSAHDPQPIVAEGIWRGEILREARGEAGFGYDPIFLPLGFDRSAAELSAGEKNQVSHRAQALAQLAVKLKALML